MNSIWTRATIAASVLALIVALATVIFLNTTTVVIIVRHAERAAAPVNDPPLTAAGQQRAITLAHVAGEASVTRIFATEFLRTQQTVAPLATQLGIGVTQISSADVDSLVDHIRSHWGQTLLVAGHTNTIPEIIKKLGGGTIMAISEGEFDNMYVVFMPRFFSATRIVRLKYGEET